MNSAPYQKYYSSSYRTRRAKDVTERSTHIISSRLTRVTYSPANKVLDVACGLSDLGCSFGRSVYGFDINNTPAAYAKKHGIIFTKGDAEKKWRYPSGYFDIVIASHIIEHVVNPDHVIMEARRVLKKGGIFIVAAPNLAAWYNRLFIILGIQPFFSEVSTVDKTFGLAFTRILSSSRQPLGHLRMFTYGALRDMIEYYQFDIIQSFGMEFVPFPEPLLFIDRILSKHTSLASTFVIACRKKF